MTVLLDLVRDGVYSMMSKSYCSLSEFEPLFGAWS